MSHHGFAGGIGEILLQADEPAGRNFKFEMPDSPLFPSRSVPLRWVTRSITLPLNSCGASTKMVFIGGSHFFPSMCFTSTCGLATVARSLLRRMVRSGCRGAGYLRPYTRKLSAPSVSSTRSARFFSVFFFFHQAVTQVTVGYEFSVLTKEWWC